MNSDKYSVADETIEDVVEYVHGIRPNLSQFAQQLLQVFFVGLTIGMQRNVVPALAESEFGVPAGSFTLLMAFVVSFGFVKGAMNFVSGRISEKVGRRKVLIWGWLVALPIPFIFLYAPSWNWIVAANVLLGINQGFALSRQFLNDGIGVKNGRLTEACFYNFHRPVNEFIRILSAQLNHGTGLQQAHFLYYIHQYIRHFIYGIRAVFFHPTHINQAKIGIGIALLGRYAHFRW